MAAQQKAEGNEEKADAAEVSEYVKLKVVSEEFDVVNFKIKLTARLKKLKEYYSDWVGVPVASLRFQFHGREINDDETPRQLQMVDGDVLETYKVPDK